MMGLQILKNTESYTVYTSIGRVLISVRLMYSYLNMTAGIRFYFKTDKKAAHLILDITQVSIGVSIHTEENLRMFFTQGD